MSDRTKSTPRMTPAARAYIATVIVSGLSAVAASLVNAQQNPLPLQWYMLAALTFVSGSATVNLPTAGASISVSETFVFASVLLFGPSAGTITVALDGLVISFWMAKRRPEWYRALFNMAAPAVSIWVAAHLLFLIAGIKPLYNSQSSVNALLLPLIVFAFTYFSLNSWLIAFAVAFEARISPYKVWRQNFLWLSLNYFSGASVALLLVAYTNNVDVRFIGVIVPLLFVLYLTFKTTMGRVEDATSHVQQLNRLYLSTIETLAMAIDAKDQITHGHIRRVQQYAVRLASELGVTDERLLKAIEAAALLHDMGKLAVPEHILNKPGKLTAAEFEKMKMHATVGADILAAIDFPYPVVPIVRHHHENWDGSGYPAGLKGTDIPVGARILSVVDCFDALISDRPYRPRLSDDAALAILIERRGSMYDPWVVDTFIRVHRQIAPNVVTREHEKTVLDEIASTSQPVPSTSNDRGAQISASNAEMLMLFELARALGGESSIATSGDIVASHLRQFLPSTICVFFKYDPKHDELVAAHASGDAAFVLNGARIGLGERLSGWVAANRQTILNSDPALDLSEELRNSLPTLRSCISSPLLAGDELVGVLTLYSSQVGVFGEEHQRIIEVVGRQVGPLFKKAMLSDDATTGPFTAPPNTDQWLSAPARDFASFGLRNRFTLLFIRVVDLAELSRLGGRVFADEIMRHVARQTTGALRLADVLCRCDPDGFVAFLDDADSEMGEAVARRIHDNFRNNPLPVSEDQAATVRISVRCVSAPQDGKSIHDLIDRLALSPDDTRVGSSAIH